MADEVVIDYRARVDKLQADLKKVQAELIKTGKAGKKAGEVTEDSFEDANEEIVKVGKTTNGLRDQFRQLGRQIVAAFAVQQVISFGIEAVKVAAAAEGIEIAFKRLNNPNLLNDMRAAVRGTVSDVDLMKAAVEASNFKIPLDQLAKLFEFAARRAKDTGQNVDFLVRSIITGIGRKAPLILDNLGISTVALKEKFGDVSAEAASIGDVTKAVTEIAGEELQKMGDNVDTTGDKLMRFTALGANFKISFGNFLITALNDVIDVIDSFVGATIRGLDTLDDFGSRFKEIPTEIEATEKKIREVGIAFVKFSIIQKEQQIALLESSEASASFLDKANQQLVLLKKNLEELENPQKKINEGMAEGGKQAKETADERKKAAEEAAAQAKAELANLKMLLKAEFDLANFRTKQAKEAFEETLKAGEQRTDAVLQDALNRAKIAEDEIEIEKAEFQIRLDELKQFNGGTQEEIDANNSAIELLVKEHQENITRITQTESQKRREEQLQELAAIGEFYTSLTQITSDVLNVLSSDSTEFAFFQKSLALTNIAIDTAQAIAALTLASEENPLNAPTSGLAGAIQFAAGFARITANILKAKQILTAEVPEAPRFWTGTDFVQLNGNKPGIDTVPAYLTEGEAVIRSDENSKYPGMAKAWNMGKVDDYIMSNFVVPAIKKKVIDRSEKESDKFIEKLAKSILLNQKGFNDRNLLNSDQKSRELLKGILNAVSSNKKPLSPYKF